MQIPTNTQNLETRLKQFSNNQFFCFIHSFSDLSPSSRLSLCVSQTIRSTMRTCPTVKWSWTSGARSCRRRNVSRWRSFLTFWRNTTATNSSFQTGTSYLPAVCADRVCLSLCCVPVSLCIEASRSKTFRHLNNTGEVWEPFILDLCPEPLKHSG